LDWNKDGTLLASGSNDKMVKLSRIPTMHSSNSAAMDQDDIFNGEPDVVQRWFHTGTVRDVAFRPFTAELAAAGAGDNSVKLWSYERSSPVGSNTGQLLPFLRS
jgi:WD40 repeat protein